MCRSLHTVLVALLASGSLTGCAGSSHMQVTESHGAIIRGDDSRPELALVFTGDEYADGADHIDRVLREKGVRASFFLTGKFYRNPDFADEIQSLREAGHYLGAHSDQHLLYCSWEDRDSLLVTRDEFEKDVRDNYDEMRRFAVRWDDAHYFLPPYEWYNQRIAEWTEEMGLTLVNYTPGTRSHADYTTPDMGSRYVSSDAILESIREYERSDPAGLNGFILLMHIGTAPEREDKLYWHLGEVIDELRRSGYRFRRIDQLLER